MPPILPGDTTPAQTPSATPDAQTAAPSSGPDASSAAPSSGPDSTTTTTEPKTMAEAIAAAFDTATAPANPDADTSATDTDTDTTPTADADGDAAKADPEGTTGTKDADADKSKATGEEPGSDAAKDDAPDPSQEELASMQPKVRRRMQQLMKQRSGLRQEVESLTPDATGYRTIRQFMANNDLADQEVAELFQIGADLKSGDPKRLQAFVERVMPRLQLALEATGQAIPTDLRGRVDSGEMTEDAAKEFARVRHQATAAEARATQATKQAQTVATGQTQAAVHRAVLDWHTQTRQSDPDFDLKVEAMTLAAQALVAQRGNPRTPAEAVEFAKQAYDHATQIILKVQPRQAATRPTPSSTVASPNRTGMQPAPTSLKDAIGQAFDASFRG